MSEEEKTKLEDSVSTSLRSKSEILADLKEIALSCDLRSAGERHSILYETEIHIQNLIKGTATIDTTQDAPRKLEDVSRIISDLDRLKGENESIYYLFDFFYNLGLDSHYLELFNEISEPLKKYIKLTLAGDESAVMPKFDDPGVNKIASELCGVVAVICEESKRAKEVVDLAYERTTQNRSILPSKLKDGIYGPVYELAQRVKSGVTKKATEQKMEAVGKVEDVYTKNYNLSENVQIGLAGLVQSALILGAGIGFSQLVPEAKDYVKIAVTAVSALPLALCTVKMFLTAENRYYSYIKRKK